MNNLMNQQKIYMKRNKSSTIKIKSGGIKREQGKLTTQH